jgi:hypothetical protein
MPCGPRKYCKVSGEVLECLRARLGPSVEGTLSGESGAVSAHGCTGKFEWDQVSETLTILIVEKPDALTCEEIFNATDSAVEGCGGVKC